LVGGDKQLVGGSDQVDKRNDPLSGEDDQLVVRNDQIGSLQDGLDNCDLVSATDQLSLDQLSLDQFLNDAIKNSEFILDSDFTEGLAGLIDSGDEQVCVEDEELHAEDEHVQSTDQLLCDEDEPWIWREEGELEGVEVLVNGSVPIVYKINYPKNNENWYVFFFMFFF